jgi:hypothetical protein
LPEKFKNILKEAILEYKENIWQYLNF